MFKEIFTESNTLLADLQTAWNRYKFNKDQGNDKQAETFYKKALKLYDGVKKMDKDSRNTAGKLWSDIIK